METLAETRSSMVYEAIEASDGFYSSPVAAADPSHMNLSSGFRHSTSKLHLWPTPPPRA